VISGHRRHDRETEFSQYLKTMLLYVEHILPRSLRVWCNEVGLCICVCMCVYVCVSVCSAVIAVVVCGSVALSVAGACCCVCPAVFTVSATSSRSSTSQPPHLDDAAVARPLAAAAHHRLHCFCRRLGRLVIGTVLESDSSHEQSVLVVRVMMMMMMMQLMQLMLVSGDGIMSLHTCKLPDDDIILVSPRSSSAIFFDMSCYHKTHVTPAMLSSDIITSVTVHVVQLFNSRVTPLSNRSATLLCSMQLCHEHAVNADWSILVYATKFQCSACTVAYCDNAVGQNRAIKVQVWHWSYVCVDTDHSTRTAVIHHSFILLSESLHLQGADRAFFTSYAILLVLVKQVRPVFVGWDVKP